MPNSNAIPVNVFCSKNHVDYTFIELLHQNGLLQTSFESGNLQIPEEELPSLEKMIRLHYDMDVNLEGIEVVSYLLHRIESLQQELLQLKNRVALYESMMHDEDPANDWFA